MVLSMLLSWGAKGQSLACRSSDGSPSQPTPLFMASLRNDSQVASGDMFRPVDPMRVELGTDIASICFD
eukprot:4792093-Pyramimonas_sp.AAC.1